MLALPQEDVDQCNGPQTPPPRNVVPSTSCFSVASHQVAPAKPGRKPRRELEFQPRATTSSTVELTAVPGHPRREMPLAGSFAPLCEKSTHMRKKHEAPSLRIVSRVCRVAGRKQNLLSRCIVDKEFYAEHGCPVLGSGNCPGRGDRLCKKIGELCPKTGEGTKPSRPRL